MIKLFKYNKDTLSYEGISSKEYAKAIAPVVIICGALFFIGQATGTNQFIINKLIHRTEVTDTLRIQGEAFSEDALIESIKSCNLKYPHIVFAQAKLESGKFTSRIFRQNHNMFGMRKAHQRITAAETEKDTYAYYRDFKDCLYDYAMYQATVLCNVTSEKEYFNVLGERYAEDTAYVSKLKKIIKEDKLKEIFEE